MATGTAGSSSLPTQSAASTSAARPADRERYIEAQLRKTRRAVRGVEFASRLMLFLAASVAFFLVAALVDHWIAPGGLGVYGRLAFLAIFLIGAGYFAARQLAPLLIYRINPLFAAHTIERAKPGLKNALVNFLFLRSNRAAVPDVVLSAVEEQAATNLSHTPIDHVVDRTRLIHIGYLLLAMVAAFALYYLASPKSPLQTVGRVILPWADLQPPSRVMLHDIQPGTTTVFRGQRVTISAEVLGLDHDESVTLYYTTTDRQNVDQPLRMYVSKDAAGRHSVSLPPETAARSAGSAAGDGLQQDVEYRIEAGDAVSNIYRLSVIHAPNIVVEKVDYAYPEYTRLQPETVAKTGDLKAVEGTQVTLHALANQPIKSAYVEFGGDRQSKQPMKVNGPRATTTFTLALNKQRTGPVHSNYMVRFVSDTGHENPEPIRYRIEVTPDPAPDLQLLRPEKVEAAVPLNVPVQFELEASDPLYGLADVKIVANLGGKTAFRRNWTIGRNDKSAGRFVQRHSEPLDRITLDGGAKLKAGDVIEYWAEAVDNKLPNPNVTKSDVRKLIIVEPQRRQDQQQPQPNDGEGQQGDDSQGREQPNQKDQRPDKGDRDNQRKQQDDAARDDKQGQPGDQQQPSDERRDADGAKDDQRDQSKGGAGAQKEPSKEGEPGQKNEQKQPTKSEQKQSKGDATADQDAAAGADKQGKEGEAERQPTQEDDQRPVDKSDEGEAFDRILKHAEEEGKTADQAGDGQDKQRADSKESPAKQPSDKQETKRDDPSDAAKSDQRRDETGVKDSQTDEQPAEGPDKTGTEKKQPGEGQQKDGDDKAGETQPEQEKKGEPGAGKSGGKTPAPQEKVKPKSDQQPGDRATDARDEQQEKSPAHGKNDSDTKGQESGDRTGAGKAGGGKSDNRAGKGASGANEAADDGGGAAKQIGKGQKGADAGDDKAADDKTGKSGTEKGDGSKTRKGTAGAEKTEKTDDGSKTKEPQAGETDDGTPKTAEEKQPDVEGSKKGDAQAQDTKQKSQQPTKQPGKENGEGTAKNGKPDARSKQTSPDGKGRSATGGGGTPEGDPVEPPDEPRVEPTDDKANLEYAKRATDLALDHLRNQLKDGEPDQELLDRLGWSKEDLQKLLARWEKLEREAKQPGPQSDKAKENLQEAISSLGLKRPTRIKRDAGRADDAARGLRDAARSAPPPEYADDYEAFKRSTSRAK